MLVGIRELIAEWRAEAERARGRQDNPGYARGLEAAADDLEQRLQALENVTASLAESVEISGNSRSTLYRHMGSELENVGAPGEPRLRVLDLPLAAGKLRDFLLRPMGAATGPPDGPPSLKKPRRRPTTRPPASTPPRLPRQPLKSG